MKGIDTLQMAVQAYEEHKKKFETWPYGQIVECWKDENGNVCIRYEKGKWWHYKNIGTPQMEWW